MEFKQFLQNIELNECVVAAVELPEGTVVAKNRDRGYVAKVEILHELIDGIEVVLWHDTETDWCEGMNEYGICIVNSSLQVVKDEKEGNHKDKDKDKVRRIITTDGKKIRMALANKKMQEVIDCLTGKTEGCRPLTGHTLVTDGKDTYSIEIGRKTTPVVEKMHEKITVRTNHGIQRAELGYTTGKKKESSHDRMHLAHDALKNAKEPMDVLNLLKNKYKSDPFLNPYRVRTDYNMQTTGQILLDPNQKQVIVRMDKKEGQFLGVRNLLPKSHKAKISVLIK